MYKQVYILYRYEQQLESDWKYIIEDSDSKVVVAANDSIYMKIRDWPHKVCVCVNAVVLVYWHTICTLLCIY